MDFIIFSDKTNIYLFLTAQILRDPNFKDQSSHALESTFEKTKNEKEMPFRNEEPKPRETAEHYKAQRKTPPESPVLEDSRCETDPSNRQIANHGW